MTMTSVICQQMT